MCSHKSFELGFNNANMYYPQATLETCIGAPFPLLEVGTFMSLSVPAMAARLCPDAFNGSQAFLSSLLGSHASSVLTAAAGLSRIRNTVWRVSFIARAISDTFAPLDNMS